MMTLHKLSHGTAYEYYMRHTAAADGDDRGRRSLVDYYGESGQAAGRWMGRGLVAFDGITAGDAASEAQLRALFGEGLHPDADRIAERVSTAAIAAGKSARQATREALAAVRLRSRFPVYEADETFRDALAQAYRAHNLDAGRPAAAPIAAAVRARIRTRVARGRFAAQYRRDPADERELSGYVARTARPARAPVFGYDFTFSPPKSVSVAWALATPPVAAAIETAHQRAVADAVEFLQDHAVYTRLGRNGVRQVDVDGLIAVAFTHRASRAGDPDLHTHVTVPNLVRTLDGKWRTLDGRLLYQFNVAASEVYNTRTEHHLAALAGARFAERDPTESGKRAVREWVGIDARLNTLFAKRDQMIRARTAELAAAFQREHGREPDPTTMIGLAQQATLDTRARKHTPAGETEQRAAWAVEAETAIGAEALAALRTRLDADHHAATLAAHAAPAQVAGPGTDAGAVADAGAGADAGPGIGAGWIDEAADRVVAVLSQSRSVWRVNDVHAETARVIRAADLPATAWEQTLDRVVAAVTARCLPVTTPDPQTLQPTPGAQPGTAAGRPVNAGGGAGRVWTRRDGASVYSVAASARYTTTDIVAAESRLLTHAATTGAAVIPAAAVDVASVEFAANHDGRTLNPGQAALVRAFATSGRGLQVAIAPAGTGKTTAMQVLANAWRAHGGTVLGLAPTARAAKVLAADIDTRTETIDKLTHTLLHHTGASGAGLPEWVAGVDARTLVIIDEAAKTATLKLDAAVEFLRSRGAVVRAIGDDKQLAAVAAGGVVADLARQDPDAVTLSEVMRFPDPAEQAATLAVRAGDPAAVGFYLDNSRLHVGTADTVAETAYQAWAADHAAGLDSVLLAHTRDTVTALNARARADRLTRDRRTGDGPPATGEIALADGLHASAGDIICTRRNDASLRVSPTDWVRNGDRWQVTATHPDGAITAQLLGTRRRIVLPADYVAEHVQLGYATTTDTAQGITADTCHGVLSGREPRNLIYVMLTRGRHANHAYLATATDPGERAGIDHTTVRPATAAETFTTMIARDGSQASVTTTAARAEDPVTRLGARVDAYLDALTVAAEDLLGPAILARIDTTAEHLLPGLTDAPAYPVLRQHLALLAMTDPRGYLDQFIAAVGSRELGTAADPAAVIDWRLDHTGTHSIHTSGAGPLPWLPAIPNPLRRHRIHGPALTTLDQQIRADNHAITTTAHTWTVDTAPTWAQPLLHTSGADAAGAADTAADADTDGAALCAEVAVWRAALHVGEHDPDPLGPHRYPAAERRHHDHLHQRLTAHTTRADTHTRRWRALAQRLEPRLLTDPYWPVLARHLSTAADNTGIDIDTILAADLADRALPDEHPAAALRWRLTRHTTTATASPPGPQPTAAHPVSPQPAGAQPAPRAAAAPAGTHSGAAPGGTQPGAARRALLARTVAELRAHPLRGLTDAQLDREIRRRRIGVSNSAVFARVMPDPGGRADRVQAGHDQLDRDVAAIRAAVTARAAADALTRQRRTLDTQRAQLHHELDRTPRWKTRRRNDIRDHLTRVDAERARLANAHRDADTEAARLEHRAPAGPHSWPERLARAADQHTRARELATAQRADHDAAEDTRRRAAAATAPAHRRLAAARAEADRRTRLTDTQRDLEHQARQHITAQTPPTTRQPAHTAQQAPDPSPARTSDYDAGL